MRNDVMQKGNVIILASGAGTDLTGEEILGTGSGAFIGRYLVYLVSSTQ